MTPLLTGIYTLFAAEPHNTFYTAIGGRMYHAEANQGATFPYCVVSTISHEHDWNFTDTFENVLVQFSIFTNESSASNIGAHWGKLIALFDDASITVSGYSQVNLYREQSRLLRDPGNNVWHYATDYEVVIQAN